MTRIIDIVDFVLPYFSTLSLSFYGIVAPSLGLSADFSDEIYQIAKIFSIDFWRGIRGEESHFDRLQVQDHHEVQSSFNEIWESMLEKFHGLDQQVRIYEELKKIKHDFQKYARRLEGASWNLLLFDWVNEQEELPELDLPQEFISRLREKLTKRYDLETRILQGFPMNTVDSATMNDWDRYVVFDVGISSWIQRRAKLHQLVQKWKDILTDMDIDEIKVFDEWGERVTRDKIYGLHRHFSVQELFKDLRDDGLL